jgi:hypothetical protein
MVILAECLRTIARMPARVLMVDVFSVDTSLPTHHVVHTTEVISATFKITVMVKDIVLHKWLNKVLYVVQPNLIFVMLKKCAMVFPNFALAISSNQKELYAHLQRKNATSQVNATHLVYVKIHSRELLAQAVVMRV